MLIIMLLCMAILLVVTVQAFAQDRVYTQEEKVWLLKDAYKRIYGTLPAEGPPVEFRMPDPVPPPDAVWPKLEKVKVADVCARHNMRKVVRGKTWRCRR
jgi:hypothetical protein